MKILKFFGFDRRNRSPIQENKANPPSKKEEVPISPGRVSEPDDDPGNFIHTLKGLTQMVTPSFRVEVIQLLRDLYKVNPDVNIALQDMFKLANTGHNITFPNNTDKEADKMRDHLSKVSSKWSNYTAGMDGLVNKMSDADAYIANEKGERVKDVTFTPVTGKDNQFTVALTDLAKASYQLVIPEGTFHYEKNNKEVKTQAIKESFTIGKGGSPEDPNLKSDYSIYQMLPDISGFVKDVALNGFMIKNIGYYDGLVANPDREVRLAVYDNNKTIRTGHFESYVDPEDPTTPTLLLVFDTPLREGELKADLYAIVILQGTFGDTNFGKFLEDKTTTQASDCHTNPRMTITIEVDNDKATGIEHVVNSTEKNNVIYDVQGRKVKQMNRSGIYIVNGKKFVKK